MCDSVEVLWYPPPITFSDRMFSPSLSLSLSLPQALFVHIDSSEEQSDRIMDFFNLEKDDASCL